MQAINQFGNQVENLPGFGIASGYYTDKMAEHFTSDPFYTKVPKKPESELKPKEEMEYTQVRRKPPQYITEEQRILWKKIMKRAWYHDRNFCGCTPIDCGCGMVTIISSIPILGSIIAYKMHYKMIKMCHQAGCPAKLLTAMGGNATLDFMMTLIPLLGVLLSWMKASSTRNAGLFDDWLRGESEKHRKLLESQQSQQQKLERPANAARTAPQRGDRPPPQAAGAPSQSRVPPGQARAPNQSPAGQVLAGQAPVGQSGQARVPPGPPSQARAPGQAHAPAQTGQARAPLGQTSQVRSTPGQAGQARAPPGQTGQARVAPGQTSQSRVAPGQSTGSVRVPQGQTARTGTSPAYSPPSSVPNANYTLNSAPRRAPNANYATSSAPSASNVPSSAPNSSVRSGAPPIPRAQPVDTAPRPGRQPPRRKPAPGSAGSAPPTPGIQSSTRSNSQSPVSPIDYHRSGQSPSRPPPAGTYQKPVSPPPAGTYGKPPTYYAQQSRPQSPHAYTAQHVQHGYNVQSEPHRYNAHTAPVYNTQTAPVYNTQTTGYNAQHAPVYSAQTTGYNAQTSPGTAPGYNAQYHSQQQYPQSQYHSRGYYNVQQG